MQENAYGIEMATAIHGVTLVESLGGHAHANV